MEDQRTTTRSLRSPPSYYDARVLRGDEINFLTLDIMISVISNI
jgi:hypothetical protein